MSIPLKKDAAGRIAQLLVADSVDADVVLPRTASTPIVFGDTGGAAIAGPTTVSGAVTVTGNVLSNATGGNRDLGSGTQGWRDVFLARPGNGGSSVATARALSATTVAASGATMVGVDVTTLTNSAPSSSDLQGVLEAIDGNLRGPRLSIPITDGETINTGQVVAVVSTGRVSRAYANSGSLNVCVVGICITGGTGDFAGTVSCVFSPSPGYVTGVGGSILTSGQPAFLSALTPGFITTTPPTGAGNVSYRLGYAYNSNSIVWSPGEPIVL